MRRKPRTIEEIVRSQHCRWRRFPQLGWSIHGTHAVLRYQGIAMPPLCIINSEGDGRAVAALWLREAREIARAQ